MANDATGISRKRDVFQLDDNGAPDADTSDAVGWSRDGGLGYRMLLANVNKLAERPGALGHRGPLGLYEQIGSKYRQ